MVTTVPTMHIGCFGLQLVIIVILTVSFNNFNSDNFAKCNFSSLLKRYSAYSLKYLFGLSISNNGHS